ncbi:DUF3043 domain-containing protein [Corynebacterium riegelii]|uniref:DUF3043 domain-containing protein n=1 Tax=Corynebacterium riegelii TaxID=156976 RepID=A0A0K1R9D4_9CORY|nr:DUF3043 domain-containing protein [Corynebacterium riegelii]AKV58040.1 hypothetical protein AK829_01390 [Corynebacterium riegelii]
MKLPWQKSETAADAETLSTDTSAETAAAAEPEPQYPKGYTPPKGKPTPKRHDQEVKRGVVRDPNAATPAQQAQRRKELKQSMSKEEWKAYKQQEREERRKASREMQQRIDAGDDRYLMERDRGEVRRYVRDWVDSRRLFNNYAMPFAMVLLAVMFIGTFLPRLAAALSIVTFVFVVTIFLEAFIVGKRVNSDVRKKFPGTTDTGFALGMYAWTRASQMRSWRSPKPQVALGQKV